MRRTVVIRAARTPFGKLGGSLSPLSAMELGGMAIKGVMDQAGLHGASVDEVIMGMVLQGGQGQIPSRQAAHFAGLPWSVRTETINKVCASGLRSVTLADQIIRSGDAQTIVAGGMESMSQAPYVLSQARWGMRMGDQSIIDLMVHDGLTCAFNGVHMGIYGGEAATRYAISREEQDLWALRSHQRAAAAVDAGRFKDEVMPIEVPQRKGEVRIIEQDEAVRRDTTLEKLQGLRPIFSPNGTITAGNAPGVNDGAGALILMDEQTAAIQGHDSLATILGHAEVAIEPQQFPETPSLVIQKLLQRTGRKLSDIDLFEINEAFAAVVLTAQKMMELDPEKVNVNGGAVALGHPIGASGARLLMTLIYELKRRGGGLGIAAICSGGGQGDAVLVEV
ncbi:acetyl-CoA acetyltransferase [Pullulanibacillus camelliae]|uniref:acetyl-CoA C-acetyltransferase n=1 Tax=Pullulanibacillus camelliae TaxID=1707096 RepID=A0A8J2VED7_9BACL|nr:acetyl-CoA C-acetyltransferase [Pullulanibacillus camelliae]GGE28646.1 acetyl-CoA acetyltransferase [Pullulanibacillus camelliae]